MQQPPTAQTGWRFFPLAIIGGLGLVVAVNGLMIWQALATFPGEAGRDGFALSNRYNMVLERSDQQAALGLTVRSEVDAKRHPVVILSDLAGQPLAGARIAATAERPLGAARPTTLAFADQGGGRYVADLALDAAGQWDVLITAETDGKTLTVTRRVHVP